MNDHVLKNTTWRTLMITYSHIRLQSTEFPPPFWDLISPNYQWKCNYRKTKLPKDTFYYFHGTTDGYQKWIFQYLIRLKLPRFGNWGASFSAISHLEELSMVKFCADKLMATSNFWSPIISRNSQYISSSSLFYMLVYSLLKDQFFCFKLLFLTHFYQQLQMLIFSAFIKRHLLKPYSAYKI